MREKVISRAGEIIAGKTGGGNEGYCVLVLMDNESFPTPSTISVSKADGIRWLTFCTGLGSNKAKRIAACSRASVCFATEDYNISLIGTIEVLTDPAIKKEMWYEGLGNHFTGPEDPDYCVLRFTTRRYNLLVDWDEAVGEV